MAVMLDDILGVAKRHGWKVGRDSASGAIRSVTITREEGERVTFSCWGPASQGGTGQVRGYDGHVASGLVSRLGVGRDGSPDQGTIEKLLQRQDYQNNSGFVLQVARGEHREYGESMDNYVVHQTQPGLYAIELTDQRYQRVDPDSGQVYYAVARVNTMITNRHEVNRIFNVGESRDIEQSQPASILWTCYNHQLSDYNPTELFRVIPQ